MQVAWEQVLRKRFGKVKVSRGKHGTEFVVRCPFCNKKDKCYINPIQGQFICFCGCDAGKLEKLKIQLSVTPITGPRPDIAPVPSCVEPPGNLVELTTLEPAHPAITYLGGRGFDPQELNDNFGVRYCTSGIRMGSFDTSNTIVFPIWMNQTVVGWQARLLYNPDSIKPEDYEAMGFIVDEDGEYCVPPKYMTNRKLQSERVLYNYDCARLSEIVIICEGPLDAIRTGRCAVATIGKGVKETQTRIIKAYWKAAIILLDPGDADKEMLQLYHALVLSIPVAIVRLQGYKDAGETPRAELWKQIYVQALEQGLDISKYKITI
jgi:hypothetical protein